MEGDAVWGGGGGCDRFGLPNGGRGAAEGGGGGAAGGGGAEEGGGGAELGIGGANAEGFLAAGTGGFFPIGGGGPFIEAEDDGLGTVGPPVFLRLAIEGTKDGALAPFCVPGLGGAAVGGLGAAIAGGRGAELMEDSGSDVYDESRFAVEN